jgi:hypothetical protein
VGFHAWSLRFAQDIDENKRGLDLAYNFGRPRFPVFVAGSFARDLAGFVLNEQNASRPARFYGLSVGSSFGFPGPLRAIALRTQYAIQYSELIDALRFPLDPNLLPPALPRLGTNAFLTGSLTYSTVQMQPYDISRSYGPTLTLSATYSEPYLGAQERAVALGWRAEQYVRFGFQESVLAMAYTGSWNAPVALGGYAAQNVPLVDQLVFGTGSPQEYARLRGYPLRRGNQLHVAQLEYRLLIVRINRGLGTLPAFARRIHAAVFCDAGDAYAGSFELRRLGVGAGGELRLDWAGGNYATNHTLRLGIARGLTEGGQWQWYVTTLFPF